MKKENDLAGKLISHIKKTAGDDPGLCSLMACHHLMTSLFSLCCEKGNQEDVVNLAKCFNEALLDHIDLMYQSKEIGNI